jgi:hypothetical protein
MLGDEEEEEDEDDDTTKSKRITDKLNKKLPPC